LALEIKLPLAKKAQGLDKVAVAFPSPNLADDAYLSGRPLTADGSTAFFILISLRHYRRVDGIMDGMHFRSRSAKFD